MAMNDELEKLQGWKFIDLSEMDKDQLRKVLQLMLDRMNLRATITNKGEVGLYDMSSLDD